MVMVGDWKAMLMPILQAFFSIFSNMVGPGPALAPLPLINSRGFS